MTVESREQTAARVVAISAVQQAVRTGTLVKPEQCESCGRVPRGRNDRLEAHHARGYDEEHWLDIRWLCVTCHVDTHAGGSAIPRTSGSWWGLRDARGWSLRELSTRSGINPADLSRIERGIGGATPDQARSLLAVYDERDG